MVHTQTARVQARAIYFTAFYDKIALL